MLDKDLKEYPKSRVTEVVNLALALVAAEVAKGNKVQLTGCVAAWELSPQGCV